MPILVFQFLANIIILGKGLGRYLRFYKWTAFLLYPLVLTIFVVLSNNQFSIDTRHRGIVLDITELSRPTYYIMLVISLVMQIGFNTQYQKLVKK